MSDLFGTYHLAERPELFEPSRSNAFQFVLTDLEKLLPAGAVAELASDDEYITDAQDIIKLSVASTSVPHFTVDPISIRRGNSVMKFAGTPTFSEGTLVINDYVGARVKDILLAWQALTYDVTKDVVNLASKYKHDCFLYEYTPDFSKVVRYWRLVGCWVSGLNESEFSHDSSDKRTVSVTIQYDRAIPGVPTEEKV